MENKNFGMTARREDSQCQTKRAGVLKKKMKEKKKKKKKKKKK